MNLTYLRAGKDWVALNAQHDVVGIIKPIGDSWKVNNLKRLKIEPSDSKGGG